MAAAPFDFRHTHTALLITWADKLRDQYQADENGAMLRMYVAVRLVEDQIVRFMLAAGRESWSPTLGIVGGDKDLSGLMDVCAEEAWACLAAHEVTAMKVVANWQTSECRCFGVDNTFDLRIPFATWNYIYQVHDALSARGSVTSKTALLQSKCNWK
jgi:hypothetical protein